MNVYPKDKVKTDDLSGINTRSEPETDAPRSEDNWAGRGDSMKCKTCISYCPKAKSLGRCRRNAPTMSGFPVVWENDWCFSHKLDETKI